MAFRLHLRMAVRTSGASLATQSMAIGTVSIGIAGRTPMRDDEASVMPNIAHQPIFPGDRLLPNLCVANLTVLDMILCAHSIPGLVTILANRHRGIADHSPETCLREDGFVAQNTIDTIPIPVFPMGFMRKSHYILPGVAPIGSRLRVLSRRHGALLRSSRQKPGRKSTGRHHAIHPFVLDRMIDLGQRVATQAAFAIFIDHRMD